MYHLAHHRAVVARPSRRHLPVLLLAVIAGAFTAAAPLAGASAASAHPPKTGLTHAAAATTTSGVKSAHQAAYLVGGNNSQFEFVSGRLNRLREEQCDDKDGSNNYLSSGLQLIDTRKRPNKKVQSAAVGVECGRGVDGGSFYSAGWAYGYPGNTFPHLTAVDGVKAGDEIKLQLFYNKSAHALHFRAFDMTTRKSVVSVTYRPIDKRTHKPVLDPQYTQAVLGGVVANPLPHPPPPGTSEILQQFTGCKVITYADRPGIGIKPPPGQSWNVRVERAFSGTSKIADVSALKNAGTAFHVRTFGH